MSRGEERASSQISMSWGGGEFTGENTFDSHFVAPASVTYFAASGDTGGKTIYPGTSPWVVAAGGTSLTLDQNGAFVSETGWSGSGGGPVHVEAIPGYQNYDSRLATLLNGARGVPDFSFDADPNTGVAVYDSTSCQRLQWAGWSSAEPASRRPRSQVSSISRASTSGPAELCDDLRKLLQRRIIYGSSSFRDITEGLKAGFSATASWDFVTGVGSNLGTTGK